MRLFVRVHWRRRRLVQAASLINTGILPVGKPLPDNKIVAFL
jgi:hypothetical protein